VRGGWGAEAKGLERRSGAPTFAHTAKRAAPRRLPLMRMPEFFATDQRCDFLILCPVFLHSHVFCVAVGSSFSSYVCCCFPERVQRLRQAQEEAEKTIRELKEANKASFAAELAQKGQGEQGFAAELKKRQEDEAKNIAAGYEKNKQEVIDLLLRHVCTVELEVGEALKQSLLTKAETGQQ
jgi:hypothetical protein